MLILGVDPGIAITGYGLLEQNGNRIKPLKYGVIRTSSDLMAEERLMTIHQKITDLVKEYKPEVMVVEELFFNKWQQNKELSLPNILLYKLKWR